MSVVAHSSNASWWSSAVVAAVVAGAVSLTTLWITGRRAERERRRKLLAEAFQAPVAYREFVFRVRRRKDDSAEERVRISDALNEVQARLNYYEAILRVEAPRVSMAYSELVRATRDIAGRQISEAWERELITADTAAHIPDVDFSGLERVEEAYLREVGDFLSFGPWWLWRAVRWLGRRSWPWRQKGDADEGSERSVGGE
jgi:hypothetical protein